MTNQPASIAMYVRTPDAATSQSSGRLRGTARRRQYVNANSSTMRISTHAIVTIVSNAQCTTLTLDGRSSSANASSPWMLVSRLNPARIELRPGIRMPPATVLVVSSYRPKMISVWSVPVCVTTSIAANLAGWSL